MLSAEACYAVFQRSIDDYHRLDDVDTPVNNPYGQGTLESLLYAKNWIDTVQWHLEDIIRDPGINPNAGIAIKRRIDRSNQERTDIVEKIDDYFAEHFRDVTYAPGTRINSETPAWLLDRMSILMLKIFHMKEQVERKDADSNHIRKCSARLATLMEQRSDMWTAFDELIEDVGTGRRKFKVYRQMKMYNDSTLNPVLYKQK